MRSTTIPETRGRTSETRVGAIRPGNSRTIARACGLTVTMLTSGKDGCVPAPKPTKAPVSRVRCCDAALDSPLPCGQYLEHPVQCLPADPPMPTPVVPARVDNVPGQRHWIAGTGRIAQPC